MSKLVLVQSDTVENLTLSENSYITEVKQRVNLKLTCSMWPERVLEVNANIAQFDKEFEPFDRFFYQITHTC